MAGGGEGEATTLANAVEVVGGLAVHAALILALLVLVEFLEAVLGVRVVLDVVALVLLNVTLVLEGKGAPGTPEKKKKKRGKSRKLWLTCIFFVYGQYPEL